MKASFSISSNFVDETSFYHILSLGAEIAAHHLAWPV
jgi:hypothetical protein